MYKEERFNSVTHMIGTAAAIAGTAALIMAGARQGDPWKVVSFSIYGTSLILLYLFSTLYHSLRHRAKGIFRKFDHLGIYVLIAGTYTPFSLVTLRGRWGWWMFGLIWGLAVLGILVELSGRKGPRVLPMAIYLVMGWLMIIALKPLLLYLGTMGFIWLLAGGLFYTSGLIFYAKEKKAAWFHGVWHVFVIAGSLCHYVAIFRHVA